MHVDVCIATFRRPDLLTTLLHSVSAQRLAPAVWIRIIVIDNDPEKSSKAAVEMAQETLPFPLIYEVEPARGISFARNRALSLVSADCVAFLDDDEFVGPDWLQSLLNTMDAYCADVVFGPVVGILPENAPAWAWTHPSFMRPRKCTGVRVTTGATNNVLIRTAALGSPKMSFDNDFALTGGSDTELFHRMYAAGRLLIWCDEAIAYENVPSERINIEWVCRRAFRGGQCFARIYARHESVLQKVIRVSRNMSGVILLGALLPITRFFSPSAYIRLRSKIYRAVGQLSILLGSTRVYREYASPSYRAPVEAEEKARCKH